VAEDLEDRLVDLATVDLLVVNATNGPVTSKHDAAMAGIRGFFAREGGVLAVHVGGST
jgi:hypothetical protein